MAIITTDAKKWVIGDQLRASDNIGRRQNIATNAELIPLLVEDYSYNANNVINVAYDPREKFRKGDRLVIEQNGTFKYLYIRDFTINTISVFGGIDYTYTNHAIVSIGFTPNTVFPVGFPAAHRYTPNPSPQTGTISSIVYNRREFYIIGETMYVTLDTRFTIGGGGTDAVNLNLPTPASNLGGSMSGVLGVGLMAGSFGAPLPMYFATLSGSDYSQITASVFDLGDIWNGTNQVISGSFQVKLA